MDVDILKTEIDTDPLGRGYAGMNNVAVAIDLNTVYRTRNRTLLTGSEVANAMDETEFLALSATNERLIWDVLHLGNVNPFGIEADLFIQAFGVGSTTISNLQSLRQESISRAVELELGTIRAGNVEEARE